MSDNNHVYHIGACEIVVIKASPNMPYNQYNLVVAGKRLRGQITRPSIDDVLQAVSNGGRDHILTQDEKAHVVKSLKGQVSWGTKLVSVDIAKMTMNMTGRKDGPRGKILAQRPVRQVEIVEEEEDVVEG